VIRRAAIYAALLFTVGATHAAHAASGPLSVGVVVDAQDAPKIGPRLRAKVRSALADDAKLSVRSVELGVEPATGPLDLADAATIQSSRMFDELDLDDARTDAVKAIAGYEEHLPQLVQRDGNAKRLRDAHMLLAKINFFASNPDAAKEALRRAFVLDPKLAYSPSVFPMQMKRVVIEARLLFDTLGAGVINVRSEPPDAEIWLNGMKLPHRTPSRLDAEPGPNTVELRLPGYRAVRRSAEVVSSKGDPQIAITLERDDSPESRARAASVAIAEGRTPPDLDAIAGSLDVGALIFVHASMQANGTVLLIGGLHDAARGASDVRDERTANVTDLEASVDELVHALVARLEAPSPRVVVHVRHESGGASDFRHSKYFWWTVGAAGVVAVGVALGVGLGIAAHNAQVARETVLLGGN
jgi:PEGA domain